MLNFGARRLRASKLAGQLDVPAFVDEGCDSYDQVIENEQREGLTPLELALFIQRRLQGGQSRAEITRGMGKSAQYLTYACALIEAPDWLMELYRLGRCRGLLELHELRRLHRDHPLEVEKMVAECESIGRADVQRLKARLAQRDVGGTGLAPRTEATLKRLASTSTPADAVRQTTTTSKGGALGAPLAEAVSATSRFDSTIEHPALSALDRLNSQSAAALALAARVVDSMKACPEPAAASALQAFRERLVDMARR